MFTALRSIALLTGLVAAGSVHAQVFDNPASTEDCLQLVPAAVAVDDGALDLSVAVLLDGVSVEDGQQTLQAAQEAFTRLNVRVSATFESIEASDSDAQALIDAARNHFGGARPGSADLVYLLTNKDINEDGVAGQADCIGGVRFADRAFAIGEFGNSAGTPLGPVTLQDNIPGKIMAHEIGHLLGSHHHQANCSESATLGVDNDGCTLMINDAGLSSLVFSTVNAGVSRGLLTEFAGGNRSQTLQNGGTASNGGGGSGALALWVLAAGVFASRRRRRASVQR